MAAAPLPLVVIVTPKALIVLLFVERMPCPATPAAVVLYVLLGKSGPGTLTVVPLLTETACASAAVLMPAIARLMASPETLPLFACAAE